MLGPVHARSPHAELHRPREVVEEQRVGLPLHPGALPDPPGAAAVSERQHSDLQNPHRHLLQVQALQAAPQPVGGQGAAEAAAAHQETQPVISRPDQEQHAVDGQLVLAAPQPPRTETDAHSFNARYTTHNKQRSGRRGRRRRAGSSADRRADFLQSNMFNFAAARQHYV